MSSVFSVLFLCPLLLVTLRVFTMYGDVGLQWRWPHHQPSTVLCFFQRSFKCPWQGKRDTGETRERRGWHSHLQPVLNTALSPGQIAIPYVLLGQQRWGWEETGLHSPWQTLLPACGTQEVLLPQVQEEEENQDFSLMAVLVGLTGNRPTRGGISFIQYVWRQIQEAKPHHQPPAGQLCLAVHADRFAQLCLRVCGLHTTLPVLFPCSPPSASSPKQPCAHAKLPVIITGAENPESLGSCHSFSFSHPSFYILQRLTPAALNISWRWGLVDTQC